MSAPPAPVPSPVTPANGAPPVWPPVAPPDRDAATPPVPEKLAAALDMTAELPRVVRTPAEPAAAPAPAAQQRQQFADETMELPIFRELESAWFRTDRKPAPEENGAAAPTMTGAAAAEQTQRITTSRPAPRPAEMPAPTGLPVRAGAAATGQGSPPPAYGDGARRGESWQTSADDGWRAASAATEVPVAETTQTGLPKRVPMAQLVPGGVEKPAASVQRRTPEAVRGLLSAYHRGVQRGRTNPADDNSTNPEGTPGGQQSSQSGLGPAAGSGQKEHEG
jgi:hypothetical protein